MSMKHSAQCRGWSRGLCVHHFTNIHSVPVICQAQLGDQTVNKTQSLLMLYGLLNLGFFSACVFPYLFVLISLCKKIYIHLLHLYMSMWWTERGLERLGDLHDTFITNSKSQICILFLNLVSVRDSLFWHMLPAAPEFFWGLWVFQRKFLQRGLC